MSRRSRKKYLPACVALAVIAAIPLTAAAPAGAAPSPAKLAGASEALQRTGSVSLRALAKAAGAATKANGAQTQAAQAPLGPEVAPHADIDHPLATTGASSLPPPSPANTPVTVNQVRSGFEGLNHADQRLAGGGNQFSLEPPDQGLCVGAPGGTTFVVESVNDALQVFDGHGVLQVPPITLSAFFGLPPTIDRTTGRFGPFVSDPKCYFDADTQRWFHSVLVIGQHPKTGAFTNTAFTALAVSKTSDPLGDYFLYRINALDRSHANCPCFGDQPLIGADKHGFYVSTAEYDLQPFGAHFNGAQLYAIGKRALESGIAGRVIHYSNLTTQSGTLQPATSPNGQYESAQGGTEYLVSGRDTLLPDGRLRPGQVDAVTVWSLTNTAALDRSSGTPGLQSTVQRTEVYGQPVPMRQRPGPRPLGQNLGAVVAGAKPEPLPKLASNDERVNQVVFAAGHLYTGVNTIVAPGPRTGIAWFVIDPSVSGGKLSSTVHTQGYVAVANANVAFPSIGVNTAGDGVIAFTLVGANYFPSAGYQKISAAGTSGPVQVAKLGTRPEDGFTCYRAFGGNGVCRWGDYSASVAGPGGTIWNATEFIGGRARTTLANWSSFIWPVTP